MTIELENHRMFESAAELNEAIRRHLREHQYKINKTAFSVLETVSRHAVKYPGAARLKMETLANLVGKSKPVVRRAVALLEELGILERVACMRPKRGGNGGNILRILPPAEQNDRPQTIARNEPEKPCPTMVKAANEPKESIILKSSKSSLVPNTYSPPAAFYQQFKTFIFSTVGENQRLVSRMFGIYKAHSVPLFNSPAYSKADVEHVAYEALRTAVMSTKTKNIRNLPGYFNGTLDKMLTDLYLTLLNQEPEADSSKAAHAYLFPSLGRVIRACTR